MSQQAGAADQLDHVEETNMTLMEHLVELRTRLMWIGGAVIIATLVAMIFAWDIVEVLNRPLGGYIPQAIGPTDNLVVFFKVALASGAAVAMPIILYQVIAFVTPGLYPHERRALLMILPGAMILFIVGALFAFFVMIPPAVRFLQGFGGDNIRTEWTASLYIGFITRITFWIGVAFEAPLVVGFLARIGLVSGPQLLRFWRQAVVIIAIAAAFITPTIDPVNMTIVMGPLIVLFFFSVGIAYLMYKPREPRDFSEGFIPDEYRDGKDESSDDSDDDTPPDEPPEGDPPSTPGSDASEDEASDADEVDSPDAIGESDDLEDIEEGEELEEVEVDEEDELVDDDLEDPELVDEELDEEELDEEESDDESTVLSDESEIDVEEVAEVGVDQIDEIDEIVEIEEAASVDEDEPVEESEVVAEVESEQDTESELELDTEVEPEVEELEEWDDSVEAEEVEDEDEPDAGDEEPSEDEESDEDKKR